MEKELKNRSWTAFIGAANSYWLKKGLLEVILVGSGDIPYLRDSENRYFIFIKTGTGLLAIDDKRYTLEAGSIITIPTNLIFKFLENQDLTGIVIAVEDSNYRHNVVNVLNKPGDHYWQTYNIPMVNTYFCGEHNSEIRDRYFNEFYSAYNRFDRGCDPVILSYILILSCGDLLPHSVANKKVDLISSSTKDEIIYKFLYLVEDSYTKHLSVDDYASSLGITRIKLTKMCTLTLAQTPLEIIHRRLISESKRFFIYSTLSVSEISYKLGFDNVGYFCRFFKSKTQMTPKAFRAQYLHD